MKNTHVLSLSGVLLICSVLDWINQTQRRGITLCSVWCDLWSVTHALCALGVSKRSSAFSCVWCRATFSPDLKAASLISSFCSVCETSPVIRGIWFARVVMDLMSAASPMHPSRFLYTSEHQCENQVKLPPWARSNQFWACTLELDSDLLLYSLTAFQHWSVCWLYDLSCPSGVPLYRCLWYLCTSSPAR